MSSPLTPVEAMWPIARRSAFHGVHLKRSVFESVLNRNCIPAVWCFMLRTPALTFVETSAGSRSYQCSTSSNARPSMGRLFPSIHLTSPPASLAADSAAMFGSHTAMSFCDGGAAHAVPTKRAQRRAQRTRKYFFCVNDALLDNSVCAFRFSLDMIHLRCQNYAH